MSLWEQRFTSHPLWDITKQLREVMNRLPMPDSAEDQETLAYAGGTLELLEARREGTATSEVSLAHLNGAHAAASTFLTYLSGIETGQYSWPNVLSGADEVVTCLAQWPPLRSADLLAAAGEAVEAFLAKATDALERTEAAATSLDRALGNLDERQLVLSGDVERERQRILEAIATMTTQGDAAIRELIEQQDERIRANQAEWAEHLSQQLADAASHEARMAELEAQSLRVTQAVGVNSTATDYGAYADEQRQSANIWRRIASLVFTIAGSWFIASSLPWFTQGTQSWQTSLSRLGVTAAVAGVGAYAARESSQHRRQERDAKRVQLVLIALEPFIANLPEEIQVDVRKEAAQAIFVIKPTETAPDEATAGVPMLEVLRTLASKIPDRS